MPCSYTSDPDILQNNDKNKCTQFRREVAAGFPVRVHPNTLVLFFYYMKKHKILIANYLEATCCNGQQVASLEKMRNGNYVVLDSHFYPNHYCATQSEQVRSGGQMADG